MSLLTASENNAFTSFPSGYGDFSFPSPSPRPKTFDTCMDWINIRSVNKNNLSETLNKVTNSRTIDNNLNRRSLKDKIINILTWTENWNGFGAMPISRTVVDDTLEFLTILPNDICNPRFAPSADNEIVLEWRKDMSVAILSFYGDQKTHCFASNSEEKWYRDDINISTLSNHSEIFKIIRIVSGAL